MDVQYERRDMMDDLLMDFSFILFIDLFDTNLLA